MWRDNPLNSRQQRRGRNNQGDGSTSSCQVIQHVPVLLAQGQHGGQNAFDKQTSGCTLGSITTATPDHTATQSAFGRIIGWFNALLIHKGPQRLLDLENIMAGGAGFSMIEACADLQQADNFGPDRLHRGLEIGPGECSVEDQIPQAKDGLAMGQQHPPDHLRFTPTFHPSLEIAFEMRPTHLTIQRIKPVVGTVAIRTDDAGIVAAQQFLGPKGTAVFEDAKHGHTRCGTYPQPEFLDKLLPTGFIQVHRVLRLNMLLGGLNRLFQRPTDPLFLGRDTSQADFNLKYRSQYLHHVPLVDPETPTQIADQSLKPLSKTSFWHSHGPFGPVWSTANHAIQRMALVFYDFRHDYWQFAYLMAFRLGIFSQQQRPAILTHTRHAFDDLTHFLRGFQLPPMPVMPFSSPFFLPTQLWLGIVPLLRPVARGRFGRVVRILVHLLPQSRHLALQPGNLSLKCGDLGDDHPLYRDGCSFPIFLGNRQIGRQIHILSLLLYLPFFYCFSSLKCRLFATCHFDFLPI